MAVYSRRDFLKGSLAAGAGLAALGGLPSIITAQSKEPIKIGVLHSLSGTMAITEMSLRDVVLMAVEEINAKGGVMGRQDSSRSSSTRPPTGSCSRRRPSSSSLQDKVAVTFGCWTSVSRKSVLPVFENNNGLLFYPVQYEGEESARTSSTPAPRPTSSSSRPPST